MRTTIACQRCRSAKIKCHHDGTAPCKACAARQDHNCVLTTPAITRASRKRIHNARRDSVRHLRQDSVNLNQFGRHALRASPSAPPSPCIGQDSCKTLLARVPEHLVEDACHRFSKQYPVFGFLHKPTFFEQLHTGKVSAVKLCAILALCGPYKHGFPQLPAADYLASDSFASAARDAALARIDQKPDVDLVQSLIILSLHYWGNCESFRAWTLSGISARISQTFTRFIESKSASRSPRRDVPPPPDDAAVCMRESVCRTYWAAFILECMLSSGRQLPSNHRHFNLTIPLPLGEDDFEFCNSNATDTQYLSSNGEIISLLAEKHDYLGPNDFQRILIMGFQIWAELSQWICGGGRRTPEPASACAPWKSHSAWTRLMRSVKQWRSKMSSRLLYSPGNRNLKVHVSRGHGEAVATVHLLQSLQTIFLHREYIPFLAHRIRKPCGPVDPPLILETPPDGWWENGSNALFEAAVSIVQLMQEIQSYGINHNTPFSCFCVFSAGAALCYLDAWPHMAPQIHDAKVRYLWALSSLAEAEKRWPICKGWRETLLKLETLYRNINAGGDIYSNVGRDQFIQLEDRLHRFAEAEPPHSHEIESSIPGSPGVERSRPPGISRQQVSNHYPNSGSDGLQSQPMHFPGGHGDTEHRYESPSLNTRSDLFSWDQNSVLDFTASQDLLGSMLGTGPLDDWFYET